MQISVTFNGNEIVSMKKMNVFCDINCLLTIDCNDILLIITLKIIMKINNKL